MLSEYIIDPCQSNWLNSILLVPKKLDITDYWYLDKDKRSDLWFSCSIRAGLCIRKCLILFYVREEKAINVKIIMMNELCNLHQITKFVDMNIK